MVMKNCPPAFKADAVALYGSRPKATIRSAAADRGINPETLRSRVRAAGASRPWGAPDTGADPAVGPPEDANAALRKKVREREEKYEILQEAAKRLAGNRCQCVADLRAAAARCGRAAFSESVLSVIEIFSVAQQSQPVELPLLAPHSLGPGRLSARRRAVHQDLDGTHGALRITAELCETGGEAVT
ncbi:transposase [Streptomyces sp. NPDC088124]|uniref:transposase n=1 Tax=Streptomyces sp. NPDC088124 TaxID=3154654 RepID=UPI00341A977F